MCDYMQTNLATVSTFDSIQSKTVVIYVCMHPMHTVQIQKCFTSYQDSSVLTHKCET